LSQPGRVQPAEASEGQLQATGAEVLAEAGQGWPALDVDSQETAALTQEDEQQQQPGRQEAEVTDEELQLPGDKQPEFEALVIEPAMIASTVRNTIHQQSLLQSLHQSQQCWSQQQTPLAIKLKPLLKRAQLRQAHQSNRQARQARH